MSRSTTETISQAVSQNPDADFKPKIYWKIIFYFAVVHFAAILALVNIFEYKYQTWIFVLTLHASIGLALVMGVHRYYAHKVFETNVIVRFLIVVLAAASGQNSILTWVRDHRVHHKFTDTDADPYTVKKGIFFAHMGWTYQTKHPEVKRKGNTIDLSDIYKDKMVMFEHKYYLILFPLLGFILPTLLAVYAWDENWLLILYALSLSHIVILHRTFFVNSIAHVYGTRPYSDVTSGRDHNIVHHLSLGEGFHNFHHTFPKDYRISELGLKTSMSTKTIEFMARWGWAWDLKTTPDHVIAATIKKQIEKNKSAMRPIY